MTDTKKKAQKGARGKGTRAQLKAHASEIIGDVRTFDADTRRAVWVALENLNFAETDPLNPTKYTDAGYCEGELRDVLRKAENGERLFDADAFGDKYVKAAQEVYDVIEGHNGSELPDFIINAARKALEVAAEDEGVEIWLDVDGTGAADLGGFSVAGIANLLERVGVGGPELEPKRDLAGLISGVLTHDEVPNIVYDKLTDALVELHDSTDVYQDPAAVRALLDYHERRREEAEEKGGENAEA
jgi:hypothetical protein